MTLPHITPKQQEILLYLYRFRFLSSIQIQKILHNKDRRNINIWLKDLVVNNYIGRKYENTLTDNAKPARYFLAVNGIRYLKTQQKDNLTKLRREKYRSDNFIEECLFIAQCYLQTLFDTTQEGSTFNFYTKNDYAIDSLIGQLKPHFVRVKHLKKKDCFYVYELFSENIPRFFIRSRIEHYFDFFKNVDWTKTQLPPNIFFICPDEKIEKYILYFAKKTQQEQLSTLSIFVTTQDQLKEQSILDSVWQQVE